VTSAVTDADRLSVPPDRAAEIAARIGSDASPVGIDAKATHVAILHLLLEIQDRLASIERRLDAAGA